MKSKLTAIDVEAERAVLAALMQNAHREYVIGIVTPEMFGDPLRSIIASAIIAIYERGDAITVQSVLVEAKTRAALKRYSTDRITREVITAIQEYDISDRVVEADARRLDSLHRLRIIEPHLERVVLAMSQNNGKEVANAVYDLYESVRGSVYVSKPIVMGYDVSNYVTNILDRTRGNRNLYPFPWKGWAENIKPLVPGTMGLVAMPTGYGKTAIATTIAHYWVTKGHKVGYFHTEYTHDFMIARMICSLAGIPDTEKLVTGNLSDEERKAVKRAQEYWDKNCSNFHFVYAGGMTGLDVVSLAGQMAAAGDATAFIIDYWTDLDHGIRDTQNESHRALVKFHNMLSSTNTAAIVVAQGTKELAAATPDEMSSRMVNMSNASISKFQLIILGTRRRLQYDGEEEILVEGRAVRYGKKGQLTCVIDMAVDKQTLGISGLRGSLMLTPNKYVVDLDPRDKRSQGAV